MESGQRAGRVAVRSLNEFITCCLCGGYYVDATAITECLHAFCKACIVRYLEMSSYCPVCDILVHDTNPLLSLRLDRTLQDLIYKLVPGLLSNEKRRRKELSQHKVDIGDSGISLGDESAQLVDEVADWRLYTEDELIHVLLECSHNGKVRRRRRNEKLRQTSDEQAEFRHYLLCPALFTVAHIKKFVRLKFDLGDHVKIIVFHTEERLSDEYTLMDIAYIYKWRRARPLRLYYSVCRRPEQLHVDDNCASRVSRSRDLTRSRDGHSPISTRLSPRPPEVKPVVGVHVKPPSELSQDDVTANYFRSRIPTTSGRRRHKRRRSDEHKASDKRIKQEFATDSHLYGNIGSPRPMTRPHDIQSSQKNSSGAALSLPVTISKDFIKELVVSRDLERQRVDVAQSGVERLTVPRTTAACRQSDSCQTSPP